jgi:hypothetical protein
MHAQLLPCMIFNTGDMTAPLEMLIDGMETHLNIPTCNFIQLVESDGTVIVRGSSRAPQAFKA